MSATITDFGWEVKNDNSVPVTATGEKGRSAVLYHAVAIKNISLSHPIVTVMEKMDAAITHIHTQNSYDTSS